MKTNKATVKEDKSKALSHSKKPLDDERGIDDGASDSPTEDEMVTLSIND